MGVMNTSSPNAESSRCSSSWESGVSVMELSGENDWVSYNRYLVRFMTRILGIDAHGFPYGCLRGLKES
jgi:hypothetical protein